MISVTGKVRPLGEGGGGVLSEAEKDAAVANPEAQGIVIGSKVAIDLTARDEFGEELDNERVIAEGLAWNTRLGFKDEEGNIVILFEGKGAQTDKDGNVRRFPEGHEHEGYSVPKGGYILDGPGISALEHSNGFRAVIKVRDVGFFTAFGEVGGVIATFRGGEDTIRVGPARKRKKHHE
jgi:hypothetical protein